MNLPKITQCVKAERECRELLVSGLLFSLLLEFEKVKSIIVKKKKKQNLNVDKPSFFFHLEGLSL